MAQSAQRVNGKDRYNLNDHFEDVYLRSRTLKRFMDKVDHAVMADKDTFKVIEHVTNRQMSVYGKIFNWNGFDRDDIRSIVTIFAACFTGLEIKDKPKKDYYYLMMSFVDQRMEFFTGCVTRKFQVNDVACYNVLSVNSNWSSEESDSTGISPSIDLMAASEQITSFTSGEAADPEESSEEKAQEFEDKVEVLKIQYDDAVEGRRTESEIDAYKSALGRMTELAESYRLEANKKAKKERALSISLKRKFAENPGKYADQLAYYATYKGIPYDVRRAARNMCKRHNVDFVVWAKNHIKTTNSDESSFDLR